LKLVSRNGYDRTALFREPFRALSGLPPIVLEVEIGLGSSWAFLPCLRLQVVGHLATILG